jgi:hypothetical protein
MFPGRLAFFISQLTSILNDFKFYTMHWKFVTKYSKKLAQFRLGKGIKES